MRGLRRAPQRARRLLTHPDRVVRFSARHGMSRPDAMKERGLAPRGPPADARGAHVQRRRRRPLVSEQYDGQQIVGMDLHRRRSVLVRMTEPASGWRRCGSPTTRIPGGGDGAAGEAPEVVLEATYGWYWAADLLAELGATVHLAHPLGVKMFAYRRVKNDHRDAADLADLLRMGRLPEAWIAPPADPGAARLGAAPGEAGRAALEPEVPGPRGARRRRGAGPDERPVRRGRPAAAGQRAAGAGVAGPGSTRCCG